MKDFIGVKLVKAEEEWIDDNPGYKVIYADGYTTWCPKETFERANFEIEDPTKISEDDVTRFTGPLMMNTLGNRTTLARAETVTGFLQVESSSCVDPVNFDPEIGFDIARKKIEHTVRKCLGFVLQWARNGVAREEEEEI